MKKKKVGILTGGGDCPGLNAVIRAAVRTGIREYGYEVVGIESGFEGLLEMDTVPLTLEAVRGILPKGGTLLRTTNKGNPFAYRDSTGNQADRSHVVIDHFHELGLDALITIGGEGTLAIAQQLYEKGVPIVAVPKTIDNDLGSTDFSFGFMTAVSIAMEAVDRLHSTAESHNRVMILEVMGRHVGWIALYAGIAGGADIILIPEIPYDPLEMVRVIKERQAGGALFDIIVVAEGAKRIGGEEVYRNKATHQLGGVGYQVADEISQQIDLETRVTVLGHVQRGGSPNSFDRILATRYGKSAMELVADEQFGMMTAFQGGEIVPVTIKEAVSRLKSVETSSELVRTARALGISFGESRRATWG